ncbi:hypothetical protein, partial [Thiolapillus sp.]|uniref:hypothetical protein n=1 Tax=Thiolapillus sp. TaxID=2017437 RepID=UPI0025F22433
RASDLTSLDPAERLATDGEAGTLRQGRLLGTSSNEANTLPVGFRVIIFPKRAILYSEPARY